MKKSAHATFARVVSAIVAAENEDENSKWTAGRLDYRLRDYLYYLYYWNASLLTITKDDLRVVLQ